LKLRFFTLLVIIFIAAGTHSRAQVQPTGKQAPGQKSDVGTSLHHSVSDLLRYEPTGLSILEPYVRGKIPVVFIHGLWSTPWSWQRMIAALDADPALKKKYQMWTFGYSTGDPIPYSATLLRKHLDEARGKFDPDKSDPAFAHMVVIGHSMGGLLAKMLVVETGTRLWQVISDRPFEQLAGEPDDRTLFRGALFFQPQPEVRLAVFIATPHQGTRIDQGSLQHIGTRLLRVADPLRAAHDRLVARNENSFFREQFRERIPTSIDELAWGSPILTGLHALKPAPSVKYHSIIAALPDPLRTGRTDGLVTYESAHLEGAASEEIVSSGHLCQEHSAVISEVRRILLEHAGSQVSAPKAEPPALSAAQYFDRGNKKAATGDLPGAVDDLTRAIELDPKMVEAWVSRGNVYSGLGKLDKALPDCARAIELDPKRAVLWYNRGNVLFRVGQYNKAIADFTKAIELKPTMGFAWGNRGSARSLIGDRAGAIVDYSTAIEINPRDAGAYYSRANSRHDLDDIDGAVADFGMAIEIDPRLRNHVRQLFMSGVLRLGKNVVVVVPRADIKADGKVVDTATFGTVLFVRGQEGDTLRVRSRRNGSIDRNAAMPLEEAIAHFTEQIKRNDTDSAAYAARGNALAFKGEFQKALTDHDRAIRLSPESAPSYQKRGLAYALKGDYKKALADFDEAVRLSPKTPTTFLDRAQTWLLSKDFDKALADYVAAIKLDPEYALAFNNRGGAWAAKGDDEKALADFNEALRLDPKETMALLSRAAIWARRRNAEQFARDINEALRLSPMYHPLKLEISR
jgi:tetratricopeptide (TPR) repeat protein